MKQFCLVSVCHQLISKMGPFNLAVTGQQIINPRLEQVCSYINFRDSHSCGPGQVLIS